MTVTSATALKYMLVKHKSALIMHYTREVRKGRVDTEEAKFYEWVY